MNHFRRYVPGFIGCHPEKGFDFETLEQLLSIPYLKNIQNMKAFERFSCGSVVGDESLLMVELKTGAYFVVGYLKEPVNFLPEWSSHDSQSTNDCV